MLLNIILSNTLANIGNNETGGYSRYLFKSFLSFFLLIGETDFLKLSGNISVLIKYQKL